MNDKSYLGVLVDMAGCPNRCRHCWLGSHRNGNMSTEEFKTIAEQFKNWRDENGEGIKEFGFFTWWREPDYADNYKELHLLECELSSPGRSMRFELLSTWRLARDFEYAKWAATLEPNKCQITFFGMEKNTDWGMCRMGAFNDQLLATQSCFDVGIEPRWQLFLTKRCLNDLDTFYDLYKSYEEKNYPFELFIGGMSPEGNGWYLEDERLDEDDIKLIPEGLLSLSDEGLESLGLPEYILLDELSHDVNPPNINPPFSCVEITCDYDVYPNIAEATEWWRLGNLKTDGVNKIMDAYYNNIPPAMKANVTIPIKELAEKYGDIKSKKLYTKDDLICRFMHQWGMDYLNGV